METVLCSFCIIQVCSVLMRSFKCHNVLHVESMVFLVFVFACLLLHLSNTFPNAILLLASLLLSCVAANGRIRSFSGSLLLLSTFSRHGRRYLLSRTLWSTLRPWQHLLSTCCMALHLPPAMMYSVPMMSCTELRRRKNSLNDAYYAAP
jgi:hypothetical protein